MYNQKLEAVARPATCPSCHGKIFETLAKVITVTALWRCRVCDHTWTIQSLKPHSPRTR